MKMTTLISTAGLMAVVGLTACSHNGTKQTAHAAPPAPPTAAQQAATQLESERSAYINSSQGRIDRMTQFSQNLRVNASKLAATDPNRAKKQENAAEDLDSLLNDARTNLAQVKNAAAPNWVDWRRDEDKALSRAESQYTGDISLLQ